MNEFNEIIHKAWAGFDGSRKIIQVEEISAMVSTNHVYRISFEDGDIVIAKLSSFGRYDHFKQDHRFIHTMANNLLYPFENVIGKSLLKNNRVYTYRYRQGKKDIWVVFYNPVRVNKRMPKRLDEKQIRMFGRQIGRFHKACSRIRNNFPKSSKTLRADIHALLEKLDHNGNSFGTKEQVELIRYHCNQFLKNRLKLNVGSFEIMPVFIDWNIGNFSVTEKMELYARWDYDWFRMSYRTLDFYFFSRICSDVGDRTVFTYNIQTMMEERFLIFLEEYHKVNPIKANEIRFLRESYRFFILNYVIKDGNYFFNDQYARKLKKEALEIHLKSVDTDFDPEKIIRALNIKEEASKK